MPDTITPVANTPPDWEMRTKDLLCPLCGYNLRGLTEGRCPECGFAFTWQELLDAERDKHLYLFEHGKGRNIKSFWRTYWRTCRPRRFWTDINPAQPVRFRRLMIYWLLACGILLIGLAGPKFNAAVRLARINISVRNAPPAGFTPAGLRDFWPLPSESGFWRQALLPAWGRSRYYPDPNDAPLRWGMIFFLWPWLTLVSLLVFRISMRKAKIKTVHLLRSVIYSCDFGLLFGLIVAGAFIDNPPIATGWLLVAVAFVCGLITTYRLAIAFDRYLRVHRPLETVLASQLIAFLIAFVAVLPIADFSRRV